jgi:hypothetical protein
MGHGDPGIEWEEANAANEDGQAVMDAERRAAELDAARVDDQMPLTCDGCKHAPGSVLAVLHAGPRPAGSLRVTQLLCDGCAGRAREMCERAGRPVTFLALSVLADAPDIHTWFGLTYSNYLVLPRTLLQSMPDAWQRRFTAMLGELDAAFSHIDQAQAYKVDAAEEHEVSDLTAEQLAAEGITVGDGPCEYAHDHGDYTGCYTASVYTDAKGREMEHWERVLIPVPDPVPPYNRGRTRITRAEDLTASSAGFPGEPPF